MILLGISIKLDLCEEVFKSITNVLSISQTKFYSGWPVSK